MLQAGDERGGRAGVGGETVRRHDRERGDRVGGAELVAQLLRGPRRVTAGVGEPAGLQPAEHARAERAGDDETEDEEDEGGPPASDDEVAEAFQHGASLPGGSGAEWI